MCAAIFVLHRDHIGHCTHESYSTVGHAQIASQIGQTVAALEAQLHDPTGTTTSSSSSTSSSAGDSAVDCSTALVHTAAEAIKKQLTYNDSVDFRCTLTPTQQQLLHSSGDTATTNATVQVTVSKADFEHACSALFDRGLAPVVRLLSDLSECCCCAYFLLPLLCLLHAAKCYHNAPQPH